MAKVLASCLILFWSCRAPHGASHWYKGNLHAHTLWSDGSMLPEELVTWYVTRGYQFLGISDHNRLLDHEAWISVQEIRNRAGDAALSLSASNVEPISRMQEGVEQWRLLTFAELQERFEQPERFILLQSEEVTSDVAQARIHVNAVNISEVVAPVTEGYSAYVIEDVLRRIDSLSHRQNSPAIGIVNHPNFAWALSADDLANVKAAQFVEIFNGHPSTASRGDLGRPSVVRLWDMANAERVLNHAWPPLFGVAGDDTHARSGTSESSPGRGWIMVRAPQLRRSDLINAMQSGDFYASTGVTLKRCEFDSRRSSLLVSIQPDAGVTYDIEFVVTKLDARPSASGAVGNRWDGPSVGVVAQRTSALEAEYVLKQDDAYVRATVTASRPPRNPIKSNYTGDDTQFEQAFTQPVGWQHTLVVLRQPASDLAGSSKR